VHRLEPIEVLLDGRLGPKLVKDSRRGVATLGDDGALGPLEVLLRGHGMGPGASVAPESREANETQTVLRSRRMTICIRSGS
jgi:hypothetical protein